ncbi:DUF839 domain-containing protein [Verrucomicrobiaceae bacterium 5K15]|uniref:DUF839 domain-containing protein n=1 Tax=Oceaniferula flava TaxID=2800421 RepID=A0AAE2SEP1_9BACT|nr:alkaline phosphatase PhoX [Oceaniferula flavus]MBK1855175.1 DUF839 domain-containing protein [Oceaniferula flavus]MBM1136481.1 DUF839 domain-containing protein [Oceaniferula flavus]
MHRRNFLKTTSLTGLSFLGLKTYLAAAEEAPVSQPLGKLLPDPAGILDLPAGFSYTVLSQTGDRMSDGLRVPGMPDGMAAFAGKNGRVVLVRNHELSIKMKPLAAYDGGRFPADIDQGLAYMPGTETTDGQLGGTTNVVYNPQTKQVEKQFLSLAGTDRNCAGGAMPWGSWITCEEPEDMTSEIGRKHGYCFEVKATENVGLQKATPLKALGRFCHEAVALDPRSGILYLTEDISDGLLYRFIPEKSKDFSRGKLQAMAVVGKPSADLRNYEEAKRQLRAGEELAVEWIDLRDVDTPDDDLRHRGHRAGAARMARGEGIIFTDGQLAICCTDGGPNKQGQIFKLTPSAPSSESGQDRLELFLEPTESDLLTNGDNLCVAPWGDLVICEDLVAEHAEKVPHLRIISPSGQISTLARNAKDRSEFAGCCFSPDGSVLFVNMQGLGLTLAITGFPQRLR